jgi:hypothetical protein
MPALLCPLFGWESRNGRVATTTVARTRTRFTLAQQGDALPHAVRLLNSLYLLRQLNTLLCSTSTCSLNIRVKVGEMHGND